MRTRTLGWVAVAVGLLGAGSAAWALGTLGSEFTYQGRLTDDAVPADGTYYMRFRLYDGAAAVTPLATYPAVSTEAVEVSDGLFTVQVDFGFAQFAGNGRWLEIEVNGVTLTPRQELTVTPYAAYAPAAGDADTIGGLDADDLALESEVFGIVLASDGSGSGLDADRLDGLNSGDFLRSNANDTFTSGTLTIASGTTLDVDGTLRMDGAVVKTGTGLVNNLNADLLDGQHGAYYQDASNLNAGTLAEARLPQNAIDGSEIENGSLTDADISTSAAIAPSKISGTAWTRSTDGYPPLCDYTANGGFLTTSGSYVTVTSVTINLPSSGYVYADASAATGYWDGPFEGYLALGIDSTTADYYSERFFDVGASSYSMYTVGSSRIVSLGSGSHTIRFLARRDAGTGNVWLPRYSLSVVFIDTQGKGDRDSEPLLDSEAGYVPAEDPRAAPGAPDSYNTAAVASYDAMREALAALRAETDTEMKALRAEKDAEIDELWTRVEALEALVSEIGLANKGGDR